MTLTVKSCSNCPSSGTRSLTLLGPFLWEFGHPNVHDPGLRTMKDNRNRCCAVLRPDARTSDVSRSLRSRPGVLTPMGVIQVRPLIDSVERNRGCVNWGWIVRSEVKQGGSDNVPDDDPSRLESLHARIGCQGGASLRFGGKE